MPLLPLQALRRGQRNSTGDAEDAPLAGGSTTRARRTRGVVLEPSSPESPMDRAKTTDGAGVRPKEESRLTAKRLSVPAVSPMKVVVKPVGRKITFAASPMNSYTEVTPYSRVYGVHPQFFDFGRSGQMEFTEHGLYEYQRGLIPAFTPTPKGQVALVVAGSPSSSSPAGDSPVGFSIRSPSAQLPAPPPAAAPTWSLGEQVLVATDDGSAWMEGTIVAVFPTDCEAEGYSVPGGTVKVAYQLGVKWVMPQFAEGTLRKKPAPASSSAFFVSPQASPQSSPQGRPQASPQASAQASPQGGFSFFAPARPWGNVGQQVVQQAQLQPGQPQPAQGQASVYRWI